MVGAKIGWRLVLTAFTLAVGLVASKAINTAWKLGSGGKPPKGGQGSYAAVVAWAVARPKDGQGSYAEVVTWAVASGAAAAAARLFAERRAAEYYLKSTGHPPPGYEQDATARLVKSTDTGLVKKG